MARENKKSTSHISNHSPQSQVNSSPVGSREEEVCKENKK